MVSTTDPQEFPCILVLDVPFPTARLASVALRSLQVDKELSPLVSRAFSISTATKASAGDNTEDSVLRVEYKAATNRMLRVAVNSFMESLALVVEVMEHLDTEALKDELANAAAS